MPHAFIVTVYDFVWSINLNIEIGEYGESFLMKKKNSKKTTIKATIAQQNRNMNDEQRAGAREA